MAKKPSSNRYSIAIFITIQSFISLLRTVEVGIENHSSSSNRRHGFGRLRHLPSGEILSLAFVFVVGFDFHIVGGRFVRDRVVGEGKTLDFGRRHQVRTFTAGPVVVDGAVPVAPLGPPPGRRTASAGHGGRLSDPDWLYRRPHLLASPHLLALSQRCLPLLLLLALLSCVGTCIVCCYLIACIVWCCCCYLIAWLQ
jgi:hypothetical protein